jgi:multiple sugar transport system ATP-binding protein
LFIDADVFNVEIPKGRVKTYQAYDGKKVIFGIRPEDIHNPDFLPAEIKPAMVECKVDVTELMGNEIFLHLNAQKYNFTARVDPRTNYKMGEKVQVAFNMGNFHLFDPTQNPDNPIAVR